MTEVQINGFKRHKTIIKILSFLEYKTAKKSQIFTTAFAKSIITLIYVKSKMSY